MCASYIWLSAPWNFSMKCILMLEAGRIHLDERLSSNKATECCRNQTFCSLILFLNNAMKFIIDTHVVTSPTCLPYEEKRASF